MHPPLEQSAQRAHGDVLSEISDGLVALLKDHYGKGPTQAKTYYQDDLVVCLLRGGFMSGNQQRPDLICEVFVLAPTDLVGPDELREPS